VGLWGGDCAVTLNQGANRMLKSAALLQTASAPLPRCARAHKPHPVLHDTVPPRGRAHRTRAPPPRDGSAKGPSSCGRGPRPHLGHPIPSFSPRYGRNGPHPSSTGSVSVGDVPSPRGIAGLWRGWKNAATTGEGGRGGGGTLRPSSDPLRPNLIQGPPAAARASHLPGRGNLLPARDGERIWRHSPDGNPSSAARGSGTAKEGPRPSLPPSLLPFSSPPAQTLGTRYTAARTREESGGDGHEDA
jgi:hypothetical protein